MKVIKKSLVFVFAITMFAAAATDSFAQGGGRGKGKSSSVKPNKPNENTPAGKPDVTNKNAEAGTKKNSPDNPENNKKSQRRGDEEFERKVNSRLPDDKELNRFKGIAKKLDTTPEILRAEYREALYRNPDLDFGQFVAANVIADNHNDKNPNITVDSILYGLENGESLGQTLKSLGMSSKESKKAKKEAESEIERSRRKNEDF